MPRRLDIELTSSRDDGSFTWRAAGAREPRGVLPASLLAGGEKVGDVVRAEVELDLEGMTVLALVSPKDARKEPERIELLAPARETPLVTSTVTGRGDRGDRGDRGPRRDRDDRRGGRGRDQRGDRDDARGERGERGDRGDRGDRSRRPARPPRPERPPLPEKPKPKRLRAGRAHVKALLESLPAEEQAVAEQLVRGGLPGVRQAIQKQNDEAKAAGKPQINPGPLLGLAEQLAGRVRTAEWRDRAEAALAQIDEVDLRDLRTVVTAADAAARDDEARALATQLRDGLVARADKEHHEWLAEIATTLADGRVVRALRLSSRPPKAGVPLPTDLATRLTDATNAALTADASTERWSAVLDALAFAPVRRKVVPASLPVNVSDELRGVIARLATRIPEIAHIFAIEPAPPGTRAARPPRRRKETTKSPKSQTSPKAAESAADETPAVAEEAPAETETPPTAPEA